VSPEDQAHLCKKIYTGDIRSPQLIIELHEVQF